MALDTTTTITPTTSASGIESTMWSTGFTGLKIWPETPGPCKGNGPDSRNSYEEGSAAVTFELREWTAAAHVAEM
jgi:hypothetical protein